jgi:hypothetical protein
MIFMYRAHIETTLRGQERTLTIFIRKIWREQIVREARHEWEDNV